MSILRPGDEKFHYSDGSHKWIPPDPDYDQEVWNEQVRQHKQGHLRTSARRCLSGASSNASSTAAKYSNRASRTELRSASAGRLTSHRVRSGPLAESSHRRGSGQPAYVDEAHDYREDQRMTADGSNAPAGPEPQPAREMPLRKMWLFGALGAVGAVAALILAPTNPGGWILLASLGGLVWVTRVELRRRAAAQQSEETA